MIRLSRRRGLLIRSLVAVAALAGVWAVAPTGVPLYDGLGFPDEPYRYVRRPAGAARTAPATSAAGSVGARGGGSTGPLRVASAEIGPQVTVSIPGGDLFGPPAAARFELTARPLAPDTAPPAGEIDGNLYRVTADADVPGATGLRVTDPNYLPGIELRSTAPTPARVTAVYRDGPRGRWRGLDAFQVGNDIYQIVMPGLGDYALVLPIGAPRRSAGAVGAPTPTGAAPAVAPPPARGHPLIRLAWLGALVLLLAGCLAALRFARSRRTP